MIIAEASKLDENRIVYLILLHLILYITHSNKHSNIPSNKYWLVLG